MSVVKEELSKVQLHSLVLFNVSDHVTRGSVGKFGVLLGNDNGSHVVVHTSFETLVESSRIDQVYLQKRLDQFRTVHPSYHILGIYHINNSTSLNSLTISITEQTKEYIGINGSFICTVFDEAELKIEDSVASFQSYVLDTLKPIKTVISTNESEFIATTTAANHHDYSGRSNNNDHISRGEHKENIAITINQLNDKILKIVQYLESGNHDRANEDPAKRYEINRLIVHLSNKLNTIRNVGQTGKYDSNLRLQTSQLSLLTEQLTVLDNLKAQISKNVIWHGLTKAGHNI